ncbi:MAG: type 1 glutamine amidotransferase domain-containing protein [Glaciecola sp.]
MTTTPYVVKKKTPLWKTLLLLMLGATLLLGLIFFWFVSLIDNTQNTEALKATQPTDLTYIANAMPLTRGKILAVVTSTDTLGNSGKATGHELTELARAYYVFHANGFEIDIASIKGGEPPVVYDFDDMAEFDYAFLNDAVAQRKVSHSMPIKDANPNDYAAVYFVGGKGAMFDFPNNVDIQTLVQQLDSRDAVIGAVCHGPAALVNVSDAEGNFLVANKQVSAFTNSEELFGIPNALEVFPFMLESKLRARGSKVQAGKDFLSQVSVDNNWVTGQNPWSVWQLAEAMVVQLGYLPRARQRTNEENTVELLSILHEYGYNASVAFATKLIENAGKQQISRNLVLMHAIVAGMKLNVMDTYDLLRLTMRLKNLQK